MGIWSIALDGLTAEQIQRGLKKMIDGGSKFEPVIPEFVKMCKEAPAAAHQLYKPLPHRSGPAPNEPASIDHYPQRVQKQLTKIGMVPKRGETHHDYCMRCKQHVMNSKYGKQVGCG